MSQAIVTELEWDDGTDETDRGWWYKLMGDDTARLLVSGTLDAESGHEEVVAELHRVIRADRIEIDLGAVQQDD